MATLEMQSTAELAQSRRKMQARRRLKNRIALTLSMGTMAFGLFWLVWILFYQPARRSGVCRLHGDAGRDPDDSTTYPN
jgi:ABC-type phosphate transport system permease subunit